MKPGEWCTKYADAFLRNRADEVKSEELRRPRYKNGVTLDNTTRQAQAEALWAKVLAFDPGQAIADALVSLPHTTYEEAALAAPDGADRNPVNVEMWRAYDRVGKARDDYTKKWKNRALGLDNADATRFTATQTMNLAIGSPPNGKPGSGRTGLCYIQQPYDEKPRAGSGSGSTGSAAGGCTYHGRPKATWKVWRWGDWSC